MDNWRIDGNGSTLPTPHSTSRTPLPYSFIPPVRSSSLPPYLQARPTPTRTLTDPPTPSPSSSNSLSKAPQLPPIHIPKSNFILRPASSPSSCHSQEEEQEWSYTSSPPDTPQSCTPLLHTQFSISNLSLSSLSSDDSESHSARSPSPFLATSSGNPNLVLTTKNLGTESDDLGRKPFDSALHFAFDHDACGEQSESDVVGTKYGVELGELSSWIPSSFTSSSSSSEDDEDVCTPCVRKPQGMEEVKISQLSPTRGSYHTVLPYTNPYGPSISSSLGTGVGMGAEIGVGTAPCFTTSQSALVTISASALESDPVSVIPISAPGGDTGTGTTASLPLLHTLSRSLIAEASASGSTFSSASALPSPSPSMSTSSYSRNPSPLPPPQIQPQPQSIQLSLSLPTTPRRSSLVRTQSTPAFNLLSSSPSYPSSPSRSPRKRAFTTFNSTASSPVSTPIRSPSKRFVSAVRVAMRDLRDVVGRLKSPERGSGSGRETPSSVLERNRSGAPSPAPASTPGLGRERSGRLARRGTSYFSVAKEGMGEESGNGGSGWRSTVVGGVAVGV